MIDASLELKAGRLRLEISNLNRKLAKPGTPRAKEIVRKKLRTKQEALAKVEEKLKKNLEE